MLILDKNTNFNFTKKKKETKNTSQLNTHKHTYIFFTKNKEFRICSNTRSKYFSLATVTLYNAVTRIKCPFHTFDKCENVAQDKIKLQKKKEKKYRKIKNKILTLIGNWHKSNVAQISRDLFIYNILFKI